MESHNSNDFFFARSPETWICWSFVYSLTRSTRPKLSINSTSANNMRIKNFCVWHKRTIWDIGAKYLILFAKITKIRLSKTSNIRCRTIRDGNNIRYIPVFNYFHVSRRFFRSRLWELMQYYKIVLDTPKRITAKKRVHKMISLSRFLELWSKEKSNKKTCQGLTSK